jgi:DNA-binding transcriptional LysR family regulator
MKLSEIRTFIAVAELGSINAAARRLRLTQPAVTRQIQRLESSLGVMLLDRSARPPTLAPAGRAALDHCREVLREVEGLQASVNGKAEPAGRFRLGVGLTFGDSTIIEPLAELRRAYPRLELEVTTLYSTRIFEELRAGRLDAAVAVQPGHPGMPVGLNARRFALDRLAVFTARPDPLPARVPLAALGTRGWVLNPDGCGYRAALRNALVAAGHSLHVAIDSPMVLLQIELVARGLGLGLTTRWALRRSPHRKQIRILQVPELDLPVSYLVADAGVAANHRPVLDTLFDAMAARVRTGYRSTA